MDKIELIQKLHEKAGISLDEAREALDRANWDVLEALLILEREGRIAPITASARTSAAYSSDEDYEENEGTKEKIEKTMRAAADWLRDLFMRIFTHDFAVWGKNGDILGSPPYFFCLLPYSRLMRF